MPVASGIEVYSADVHPLMARGVSYTASDLSTALGDHVAGLLRDDAGNADLEAVLARLATTDFQRANLEAILAAPSSPPCWRVGEALAEAYLKDHRQCDFPWPTGRDLKNDDASPAGTDLVGFQGAARFAFGEVKTSDHAQWPPSLMYGRHGMKKQLEDLCTSAEVKSRLVRYLGHHATNAPWQQTYRAASSRYIADPADVHVYGVIIRDVRPDVADLEARAKSLARIRGASTRVELRAIYLPSGTIGKLSEMAATAMRRAP